MAYSDASRTYQSSNTAPCSISLSLPLFLSLSLYLSYIRQCSDCSRTQNLKDFPPHTGTETPETSTAEEYLSHTTARKKVSVCLWLPFRSLCVCICARACVSIHVNSLQKKQHCRYTNQRVYPSLSPPPFPPPLLLHHLSIYLSLLGYPLGSSGCVCLRV